MAIVLYCQRCGNETSPERSREAVCHLCVGRELIADLVPEMERLVRKALRYGRHGALMNGETLDRVTHRARRALMTKLPPPVVESVLQQLCSEIGERMQREVTPHSRIARALPGDVAKVASAQELIARV